MAAFTMPRLRALADPRESSFMLGVSGAGTKEVNPRWPGEESNLRTRIRSLIADKQICREKPRELQAARHCVRQRCVT
jgi:hypothetical protein